MLFIYFIWNILSQGSFKLSDCFLVQGIFFKDVVMDAVTTERHFIVYVPMSDVIIMHSFISPQNVIAKTEKRQDLTKIN